MLGGRWKSECGPATVRLDGPTRWPAEFRDLPINRALLEKDDEAIRWRLIRDDQLNSICRHLPKNKNCALVTENVGFPIWASTAGCADGDVLCLCFANGGSEMESLSNDRWHGIVQRWKHWLVFFACRIRILPHSPAKRGGSGNKRQRDFPRGTAEKGC